MTGVQTCALPICFPVTIEEVAKRVIGLESYLVEGDAYEIAHKTVGDNYGEYYCIECAAHPNGGMWVLAERGVYHTAKPAVQTISLENYCEKLTPDITKQERIIDIPPNTEVCHTLDLERVQYVGIADKDGHYLITLGWTESIKLNEDVYPRKELVKKWKAYHGQC